MNYPDIPNVTFLGDAHLGRNFVEGVPLDRRGEREELVWQQFEKELTGTTTLHSQVGDLFDKFDVPNEVILRAANIYLAAARRFPSTQFTILKGNHELSRSNLKVSALAIFKAIVSTQENIHVFTEPTVFRNVGFLPCDSFKSAKEQAEALATSGSNLDFIVTHCDTEAWGSDTHNVLPLDQLKHLTKIIVNGHEHVPRTFQSQGVTVHVTGSLQPYSHGEDPEHTMYLTLTPSELAVTDVSQKCVRVVLQPGEEGPPIPDCLAYKVMLSTQPLDEAPDITVEFEEFDTTKIFKDILAELKVSPKVQAMVLHKFTESLNA